MLRFDPSDVYRPALCAIFALTVFACEGGGCSSCEGCAVQPIPGGYPLEHRVDNAVQVRLTESGHRYLEENVDAIIPLFAPNGLDFDVPPQEISPGFGTDIYICENDDCTAHMEVQTREQLGITALSLDPSAPNQLKATLRIVLDSRNRAGARSTWPVRVDHPFGESNCTIDVDTRGGDRRYVGAQATLAFSGTSQPAWEGYSRIELVDVAFAEGEGIQDSDFTIGGGGVCGGANAGFVKNYLIDQIESRIGDLADGLAGDALCRSRGDLPCPTGTFSVPDEDPSSICRFENNPDAECVPIFLGADAQGDIGAAALGAFSPGTHAYAQFMLGASGEAEAVQNGMTLNFFGGFIGTDRTFNETPAHHPCVPLLEPPPLPDIGAAPAFRGNTVPGSGAEAHVGIGVSEEFMDYAGYGMFDSGFFCIGAGTRLSQQLSTGLVSAAVMSLPDLTFPLRDAPLTISMRPQQPPNFTIGAGGEADPLIQVELPSLDIDFYVWSTERYIRFLTFRTDLQVGIDLAVAGGEIQPTIVYLRGANSEVLNSDLLRERASGLASTLETLVASIAGQLGGSIPSVSLPEVAGFALDVPPGGIAGVSEGGDNFLGIFANMRLVGTTMPITAPVETTLDVSDLTLDRASMQPETWNQGEGNSIWLSFGAQGPQAVEYEFSYRIDGGPWSAWTTDRRLRVDDDVLLLQARHIVEARARLLGEPATADTTPASQEIVVDILAPDVRVSRTVEGLEVDASDLISASDALEYRYFVGGHWSEWSAEPTVALPVDAAGVQVEVRDESGNVGRADAALIRGLPNGAAESSGCGGCRVLGSPAVPTSPLAWLGALAVLGLVVRRRKLAGRAARHGLAGLGVLTLAGGLVTGCECSSPPPCGGACRYPTGTSTAGSICCVTTDMCATYDLDNLCDPGFTCTEENLAITADELCQVSCAMCTPKPDLEPGVLATYLDAVIDASGTVYVSGYSPGSINEGDNYGDLVFGQWNGSSVEWEIVDGAPSTPITNNPGAWRGGVSAAGENVGQWTSVVELDGTFLIAYFDVDNAALKLAAGGPGAWQIHTVDDSGDAGRYAKLLLDEAGVPVIAYLAISDSQSTPGTIESGVRVARANVRNPSGPSDWTIEDAVSGTMPCRPAYCGTGQSCLEEEGQCVTPTSDCGSCGSDSVCFNGSCRASLARGHVEDLLPAYGLYPSIAVQPGGGLGLVFYDRSSGNLYGAAFDGASWGEPFLIDGYAMEDPDTGDCGMSANLAIDAAGLWHVAYVDGTEEALRYATVQADGTVVSREVVDDGRSDGTGRHPDGRHIVGDDASIAVTSTGAVRIMYQDATRQSAVVAVRAGGGAGPWAIVHFDDEDSTGYWIEQELEGATSHAVMWWQRQGAAGHENGVRVIPLN